ncbi:MAG: response regulator transcription factor [Actinobacteria bacterium]|nr:response regulator transcription factor [Actinomycetota bacterium]
MRVRLVLADDEPLILDGLTVVLRAQPDLDVVAAVTDGVAALAAVRAHAPDVVLVDLRMPGLDGVDVAARVTREHPSTRTLVLTTFDDEDSVRRALGAGAHGYVLKRSTPADLVHAVRLVASGRSLVVPTSARGHLATQRPASDPYGAALAALTERERDVLRLVARGRTNAEIAADLFLGRETVKTHVSGILAKLGARDRTHAVVIAYDSGFAR